MTNYYADRGTLLINGIAALHVKSLKFTIDEAITVVNTMTANKRSSGYKQGNRKISGSFELEIPDQQAQLDLSFAYATNDISVTAMIGKSAEKYSLIGLVQTNQDLSSSVGETAKTINFEALDAINQGGPAVNAPVGI